LAAIKPSLLCELTIMMACTGCWMHGHPGSVPNSVKFSIHVHPLCFSCQAMNLVVLAHAFEKHTTTTLKQQLRIDDACYVKCHQANRR